MSELLGKSFSLLSKWFIFWMGQSADVRFHTKYFNCDPFGKSVSPSTSLFTCCPGCFEKLTCQYCKETEGWYTMNLLGLHEWESQHTPINRKALTLSTLSQLFLGSRLKWEHALGCGSQWQNEKGIKTKRRMGLGIKWGKPKGRMRSDEGPNRGKK